MRINKKKNMSNYDSEYEEEDPFKVSTSAVIVSSVVENGEIVDSASIQPDMNLKLSDNLFAGISGSIPLDEPTIRYVEFYLETYLGERTDISLSYFTNEEGTFDLENNGASLNLVRRQDLFSLGIGYEVNNLSSNLLQGRASATVTTRVPFIDLDLNVSPFLNFKKDGKVKAGVDEIGLSRSFSGFFINIPSLVKFGYSPRTNKPYLSVATLF